MDREEIYHIILITAPLLLILGSLSIALWRRYKKLAGEAKERDTFALELENRSAALAEAQAIFDKNKLLLRKVIDANPNLIFVKNRDGYFTLVNQATADMYGTTVENLIGKRDADFNPSHEEVEGFLDHDKIVIDHQKEVFIAEEKITDSRGNIHWLQTTKRPIILNEESGPQVLGVATDISENKKLYEQLVQAQKMEAIGQLAGGIAHDFNNYLTGIIGYTGLLKISANSPKDTEYAAHMIENITRKASQLTEKLLGFARKGKNQNISVDLHACIKETLALLNCTIEKNITISQSLDAPIPYVIGDPSQMQQLMLNLIINARDAISLRHENLEQGSIQITSSLVSIDNDNANQKQIELKPGQYIRVSIKDNGCGIDEENMAKIFEPFFTTKQPGKGTGMGLAMVYGIVRNHQGTITVQSTPTHGSTFSIYLPSSERPVNKSFEKTAVQAVAGKGHILIVDDHQVILDVTSRMLSFLGYDVVTAKDGLEALRYFEENRDDVDLVILDMVMPNMGARDCYRELKKINPYVKVILSTGYGRNGAAQEILNEGVTAFVQKPYHLEKLSQVVAKVLSANKKSIAAVRAQLGDDDTISAQ